LFKSKNITRAVILQDMTRGHVGTMVVHKSQVKKMKRGT